MTHRPVPPPPAPGSYAPGTYYAPGWTEAQLAGPPPPREPRQRNPGQIVIWVLASVFVAGLVAVVLWLILSPSTWHSVTGATKPLPADVTSAQSANSRQLSPGNCVESAGNLRDLVEGIRVVPCADSHEAQVLSAYEFADDAEWEGSAEAQDRVTRSCTLSTSESDAGYNLLALTPSADSWKQGDRTGLCVALAPETLSSSLL